MQKHPIDSSKKKFLLKPIPLYVSILLLLPLLSLSIFLKEPKKAVEPTKVESDTGDMRVNNYESKVIRLNQNGLIKPLLLAEIETQDNQLESAKEKINEYIQQKKQAGIITSASVYLNTLNTGNHVELYPDELYDPASIIKVACMLVYLKQAETNPALMQQRFVFKPRNDKLYQATVKSKTIVAGKSYTVEELLYSMIVYSDNEAFWLLSDRVDDTIFDKLCTDFGIPIKNDNVKRGNNQPNFVANVNSISRFFRVLYSATYLNQKMSQYALNLLLQSDYKEGIVKGVDSSIPIAHKFGERTEFGISQLHEFGIVYLDKNPYLIGIMTKGPGIAQQTNVISDISKIAFDVLKTK
ncbi:MAG: serine hydrolase [Bacteroidota bacterium]